jgi:NAD(P)-dependent dehydrogenase (short-subunit alcohol dehydrogenase family)
MKDLLKDRVALVTGGSRGIGRAIAEAFIAEGAKVFISGRDEKVGEQVAQDLGERCHFIACDVTNGSSINAMVDSAVEQGGRLDILVNNAGGVWGFAPASQMDDETWDSIISLNLTSVFKASRAAMRVMEKQKYGRIINISSVEGKQGKVGFCHYSATKHGVIGLTKCMSKEGGPYGITVNAVCPGLVITDLIRDNAGSAAEAAGMDYDELIDAYAQQAAIGRPIKLEEVALIAVMLASELGGGVSGAPISVDGGTASY